MHVTAKLTRRVNKKQSGRENLLWEECKKTMVYDLQPAGHVQEKNTKNVTYEIICLLLFTILFFRLRKSGTIGCIRPISDNTPQTSAKYVANSCCFLSLLIVAFCHGLARGDFKVMSAFTIEKLDLDRFVRWDRSSLNALKRLFLWRPPI